MSEKKTDSRSEKDRREKEERYVRKETDAGVRKRENKLEDLFRHKKDNLSAP
jgi:hypothetical protein